MCGLWDFLPLHTEPQPYDCTHGVCDNSCAPRHAIELHQCKCAITHTLTIVPLHQRQRCARDVLYGTTPVRPRCAVADGRRGYHHACQRERYLCHARLPATHRARCCQLRRHVNFVEMFSEFCEILSNAVEFCKSILQKFYKVL